MYRYIKPTHAVSKARLCAKMVALTKQSGTRLMFEVNGRLYALKLTVEMFPNTRLAYYALNNAIAGINAGRFTPEQVGVAV